MNKPAAVGSLLVIALSAFIAGRYSSNSSHTEHSASKRILYYVDPMHPSYKSDKPGTAPDCGMALEPVYEGEDLSSKLQLPAGAVSITPEKQQLIGVRVEAVENNSGTSRLVRTTGRVAADDNRVYKLMAGTDGWIQTLRDNPAGALVKKDELLATFYSREFRNAEQAYIGSLASIDRLKGTQSAENQERINDSSARINEEQLRTLGMGEPQIKELAKTRQVTGDIDVASPVDGVVLSRSVSPQQRFERGTELYRIADLSKVWILADVFGDESPVLRPGAKVVVQVRELGKSIFATVSQNPPVFDPASRTLKLRLEANNPGLLLRPDMFVDVEFRAPAPAGISVPVEAVLDSGMQKIVYLQTSDGTFEPRAVDLGPTFGNRVSVLRGLGQGDRVVVSGNFLIDSESRMKAGNAQVVNQKRDATPIGTADHMQKVSVQSGARVTSDAGITRDPVCGMSIDSQKAQASGHVVNYRGEMFSFCSDKCRNKFQAEPAKYADEKLKMAAKQQSGRTND